ncbi:MAG: XTP/dITP diphosphatase [Caldiserica bacterium]|nr:XTP/dITP diphosphatase [Caldisericota bacterium]
MLKEIVLATKNRDKIREMKEVFRDIPLKIFTFRDFPCMEEVEESGDTLEENALIKAEAWARFTNKWALSDDTGLEVEYLGGRPGVFSSRFAGMGATYEDNWKKLLKLMEGVAWEKRKARFRCVIAIVSPQGKKHIVEGVVEGYITCEPRGSEGFGYDPVFYVPEKGKTFAEMSIEEKGEISHRGKALRIAREILSDKLKCEDDVNKGAR